jgi:hypothetical protein
MFANMLAPTAIDVAGISAFGQALVHREDEEARRSDKWRDELARRLQADLTTLDGLARGFVPPAPRRRPADRSTARTGVRRVAVAVLVIVLGIAIIAVLGLRGASAEPRNPRLRVETICEFFSPAMNTGLSEAHSRRNSYCSRHRPSEPRPVV